MLYDHERGTSKLYISLSFSDVITNANTALLNLLLLISKNGEHEAQAEEADQANDGGELLVQTERREEINDKLEEVISECRAVMQSQLSQAIAETFPQVDSVIEFIDGIVKVRDRNCFAFLTRVLNDI